MPLLRSTQCLGCLALTAALALAPADVTAAQEVLVERTMALVGRSVILLSDVRTALALGLVDASGPDAERQATSQLIDRSLVLQEVSRFAPPEPSPAAIDARVAAIAARVGSPAEVEAILARGGLTAGRLAAWIRDDLRIAAYLDQRFAAAGVAAEREVADYASRHAAEIAAAGVPAAEVLQVARDRLHAERRRELIADWLAELRRRTPVVEIG